LHSAASSRLDSDLASSPMLRISGTVSLKRELASTADVSRIKEFHRGDRGSCGISCPTFKFGRVAVNLTNLAVMSNRDGCDLTGFWAAGEIVGGRFLCNYPVNR
jgi:hypothetical protein